MSQHHKRVEKIISAIEEDKDFEAFSKQVLPRTPDQLAALESGSFSNIGSDEGVQDRIRFLSEKGINTERIQGKLPMENIDNLKGNIENFIGMAQIPIGLAGPLLINGTKATGDFFVPLATTEGALVASYNRGMKACRMSGGITSVCFVEGIQRSPFFKFDNIFIVGKFVKWIRDQFETFEEVTSRSSRFAKLIDLKTNVEGNSVILTFEFTTGDAAGQNMVTICTDQICKYILSNFDVQPNEWYIESNFSGDKKATANSFSGVRGKKVSAEVVLSEQIVKEVLKSTPALIVKYWQASTLAVLQSGSIGAQGHVANGLTALFISCGQDVACISESSIGLTRMEVQEDGSLYVSLTLPSLAVGTIGGGTKLGTQQECLKMLGCSEMGSAKKFAEICAALALAGEISIASAMSVDHFTSAHKNLGR